MHIGHVAIGVIAVKKEVTKKINKKKERKKEGVGGRSFRLVRLF